MAAPGTARAINLVVEAWERELELISSSCAKLKSSISAVKEGDGDASGNKKTSELYRAQKSDVSKLSSNFKRRQSKDPKFSKRNGKSEAKPEKTSIRKMPSTKSLQKLKLQGFWEELNAKAQSASKHSYADHMHGAMHSELMKVPERSSRISLGDPQEFRSALMHPHSNLHVFWSCFALVLLLIDVILLPVSLAWDFDFPFPLVCISTMFWLADVSLNFFTGYYHRGRLVDAYSKIAWHYLRTWLFPDMAMVGLDASFLVIWILGGGSSDSNPIGDVQFTRSLRLLRILRFARLMRLIRLPGLSATVIEFMSHRFAEIFITVIKTISMLLICVHFLGCFWFFIGRMARDLNFANNWIDNWKYDQGEGNTLSFQYSTCFHWVLAQFTPAPMSIQPTNELERNYNIFVILFSLLVVGSSISRISQSIQQALQLRAETSMRRRKVVEYLRANKINRELSSRILQLVDYKLGKQREAKLDKSLMSERLLKEVVMDRRGPLLHNHHMFSLLHRAFPTVFVDICSALVLELYDPFEDIFTQGRWAHCMVATSPGNYSIETSSGVEFIEAETTRFFAELSLFTALAHTSTLRGKSFTDVLTLQASHFADALRDHLTCGLFVYQFARSLIGQVNTGKCGAADVLPEEVIISACKYTDCYQSLHMDDARTLDKFEIHDCRVGCATQVADLIKRLSDLSGEEILEELEGMFPEICPEVGTHACFSLPEERYRAIAAMVSALFLFTDDHERFIHPQSPDAKLSEETWLKLQAFVDWSGLRSDMNFIHIVLVFLAVKGLGKAEHILLQVPEGISSPESATLYVVEEHPNLVPSAEALNETYTTFLHRLLIIQEDFSFGQFLQAENSPASLQDLQDESLDANVVKVSLFAALGVMCGIMGAAGEGAWKGSKFMDAKNSQGIVICLQHLQHLHDYSCEQIFWGYVATRVEHLDMDTKTSSGLCLARLACLCRIATQADGQALQEVWSGLDLPVRHVLIDFFLADGISETAIVFSYLPLVLTNAKRNKAVGLSAMLIQLAELIEMTRSRMDFLLVSSTHSVLMVNLFDLSSFVGMVKSSFVFQTCLEHVKFKQKGDVLYLQMTSVNWNHVDDMESHDTGLPSMMRQMLRKQRAAQRSIDALRDRDEVAAFGSSMTERIHRKNIGWISNDDNSRVHAETL
eukprot:TRINITY_DN88242_c0_g1_i1.p1 TRINITY_DN88242_c0_g1~~TRINITY_DN88242_c0_g1_i1.p1  ORF type:complete len:1180 (+),score=165.50 TRINITY_DN88242_c0_g1_i1:50-3541(+)